MGRIRRSVQIDAAAPVAGRLVPLQEVADETFSQGYLGEGLAIDPDSGYAASPFDGIVSHIADTKHAVLIRHASGIQVLIHIGVNTVELQGRGFTVLVKTGEAIEQGQPLLEFDLPFIRQAGYSPFAIVIAIKDPLIDAVNCEYRSVRMAEPDVFRIVLKQDH
ncbi:PTS glucose transporter subunit IIA [Paenibacillaceae bacterium]|nr:PTS glucose transporter subunit IIA [Paenibacillaceae bacterium]